MALKVHCPAGCEFCDERRAVTEIEAHLTDALRDMARAYDSPGHLTRAREHVAAALREYRADRAMSEDTERL